MALLAKFGVVLLGLMLLGAGAANTNTVFMLIGIVFFVVGLFMPYRKE